MSGLKFYRLYLEIFVGKGPSQEPEVDWQQPQPRGILTGKVLSSHPWRQGMGQEDCLQKNHKKSCQMQSESHSPRRQREVEDGSTACWGEMLDEGGCQKVAFPAPDSLCSAPTTCQGLLSSKAALKKCCTHGACENKSLKFCAVCCKGKFVCGDIGTPKKVSKSPELPRCHLSPALACI